jgi:hypothetical protein
MDELHPSLEDRHELARLIVARSDLAMAREACERLIALPSERDPLWRPLADAAVITYCRPFTGNRPFGALDSTWATFEDPAHQDLHDYLMKLRHKTVAHSDAVVRNVLVLPPGTPRPYTAPEENWDVSVRTEALLPRAFERVRHLCEVLGTRLNIAVNSGLEELYKHRALPPRMFDLITLESYEPTNSDADAPADAD